MFELKDQHFNEILGFLKSRGMLIIDVCSDKRMSDNKSTKILVAPEMGLYTEDQLNELMQKLRALGEDYTVVGKDFHLSPLGNFCYGTLSITYNTYLQQSETRVTVFVYPDHFLSVLGKKYRKYDIFYPMWKFSIYRVLMTLRNLLTNI
ncbi:MAG: hypothetical protein H6779_05445 [Candidatus Nomurabacteria bacterium]|nr:MAG: hypothetical protein H6779_05445 [Candidatus Nomurabacteria bacterium]